MRTPSRVITLALLLGLAVLAPLAAVDPDDLYLITFENDTGYEINYLFLSPGDSEWWGADILGSERTLEDGESLGFYIHLPDGCETFDIMAVDEDDDPYVIYDFEACDDGDAVVVFTEDNLSDEDTDFEFVTINLENELDYDIYYVFLSPGDSDKWGVDHLDEETILEPGDELALLLPVSSKTRRYDVHAVDEDNDTYTFYIEVNDKKDEYSFSFEESDMD